ncbi:glycosyltransferase, partial [Candidatus Bathyarchaeota archaeon]|nr:glycosyltransferase [Candidatus Bathyarchaeota archaeon]
DVLLIFKAIVKKENLVVVTARFLPNENLDFIPIVAGKVKDTHFYVVGPCRETSEKFLFDFKRLIAELGINNVKVLVNRPRGEYLELLLRAKIFFRTLLYETFGISVVEAMAAGCVPVVPRCGGPWFDIFGCKQGVYGFSYRSVEEAADLINMLLSDDGLRVEVATKALKRAKFFDRSVFERKILDLADRVFKAKFRRQN